MLTEFSSRYSQVIGQPLVPSLYGFNNVLQLLDELDETVDLRRVSETGDYSITLFTADKGIQGMCSKIMHREIYNSYAPMLLLLVLRNNFASILFYTPSANTGYSS